MSSLLSNTSTNLVLANKNSILSINRGGCVQEPSSTKVSTLNFFKQVVPFQKRNYPYDQLRRNNLQRRLNNSDKYIFID